MKYVPLYIKTHNTLLTSMIKIDALIKKAKEYSIDALTITDENMYGCMDFYKLCKDNNIKPIIGIEVSIDSLKFVMYAKNEEGYKNLLKITTLKSEKDLKLEDITNYNTSLICILPFTSLKLYDDLKKIFKEIFIGYQNLDERNKLDGDNLIFFNETLCLDKQDEVFLRYLWAIRDGKTVQNVTLHKENNYLISYDEFIKNFEIDKKNNEYIYENCNLEIKKYENLIPNFKCPDNLDSFSYLKRLCTEGLKKIFGQTVRQVYVDRLKYELDIINKMGFCNYFLIVWDYVKYAKEKGILVGPGRGSAAGSLVSYLLNITTVDPIKYNLIFERFLNPERITMPDIDIDFEYTRREEVINYCIQKYGIKNVAPIITFGTLGSKQVIRDVGKTLDIEPSIIDNICKRLDSNLTLKENFEKDEKLRQIINMKKVNKDLYLVATKLEGIKKHTSVHAAGVVMSNIPLDEIIPLEYEVNGGYITGYSMTYLEELGLLKMDFLALKNLTIINDCLKDINNDLTFDEIPCDDSTAMKVFENVNTLGIFQFESDGIMNVLRKFRPTNFNDVSAILALFRPGPMNNIDSYINRKYNKEKIDYFDDSLINILKPTYGIILYQEQIMQIANVMAGYSYGEADVLRRAMSKKKEDVMLSKRDDFIKRSIERGYNKDVSTKVYDLILKFAEYGFNKAHSVSYAFISYKMAYLKAHYPLCFFKQLLNMSIGSEIKLKDYFYDSRKNNVTILVPSVEYSGEYFEIKDNCLVSPLTIIKGASTNMVRTIINQRKQRPFKDIFDFVTRIYEKKADREKLENLVDSGACDCFKLTRSTMKNNLDLIINYGEISGFLDDDSLKPEIVYVNEYTKQEMLQKELDIYGFYVSNHPVTELKLKYTNAIDINNVVQYFDKTVELIVCTEQIREVNTKNATKMAFISGSDETEQIQCVVFPNLYSQMEKINVGDLLYIKGKVEKRYDKYQIAVVQLKKLSV